MPERRQVLAVAVGVGTVLAGCPTVSDGTGTTGTGPDADEDGRPTTDAGADDGATAETATGSLEFSTPAFDDGERIPERYTGVGEDVSPELSVESVPSDADTLALLVEDPDANGFVHWLLWNVPATVETIPAGIPQRETVPSLDGALQGTNGFDELGYRGPLPPEGDGPHTYRFSMHAVATTLDLEAGTRRDDLASALDGTVLDTYRITGEFER